MADTDIQPDDMEEFGEFEEVAFDELETKVMEYVSVLERTCETNELMIPFIIDAEHVANIKHDTAILKDIRNRIWKQFSSCIVDTLN
jgi:hypothetical protein